MRDAEVADAPLLLPLPQRGEVIARAEEVVHLHQVDAAAQQSRRSLHLLDAGRASARPHLCSHEERVADAGLLGGPAEDLFGAAVHRGGVDERAAELHEAPQHVRGRRAAGERLPGAEADDGDRDGHRAAFYGGQFAVSDGMVISSAGDS